jgi:hypothetical protein
MTDEILLCLTRQELTMLCCRPSQRCATLDLLLSRLPMGTDKSTNAKCFFWKAYLPIENTLNGKRPRIGP